MKFDLYFMKFENKHRKLRSKCFKPLLKLLKKSGITPTGITNFRLVLIFIYILLLNYSFTWAVIVLTLAFLLDTIDGSLARFLNTASDRGKFHDITIDIIATSVMTGSFIMFGVNSFVVVAYIIILCSAYIYKIANKNENKKSDWNISPQVNMWYLMGIPITGFYIQIFSAKDILQPALYIAIAIGFMIFIGNYIGFVSKKR